jgi:hypothetical protein
MTRPLSKSKLISYRQCPKRLWLEVHRPELREDSASTQAIFASGHKVGELAQQIFDPSGSGLLIDMQALGIAGALHKTTELVHATPALPIFEAGFSADLAGNGGALAFADVLLPIATSAESANDKTAWQMIEVKSSTSVKGYYRDDAAIQFHVARGAGVNLDSISVAVIDNQWVYQGDSDYRGLLKTEDVTQASLERDAEVREWIAQAQAIVKMPETPERDTGDHCSKPFPCGFFGHCSVEDGTAANDVAHPIQWLPNAQSKALKASLHDKAAAPKSMLEVPDEHLSAIQRRVKQAHRTDKPFIDAASLSRALTPHQPFKGKSAYFLDFETVMQAVPIWTGTRPYQTILYQFSCHVVKSDGTLTHAEFLDTSGYDPRFAFSESLIAALGEKSGGNNGPIFMYSPYERTQLRSLAEAVPKHRAAIERIISRLVDLLPITRDNYYHPAQQGSWSIKSVLPALFGNDDPELSYEKLDAVGAVSNGGAAQSAYLEAIDPATSHERKAALHAQLLAYCKLDTYAMVRLWQVFSDHAELKL